MNYPLDVRFKILALAPQIHVIDATGETVCYVKQKLFKLKELVNVFEDPSRQKKLCEIKADRIIDWSASYHFYDANGESFGSVKRRGLRSMWKAHYEVYDEQESHQGTITEENPMAKIADAMLSEVPLLGAFSGYFFHPKYVLTTPHGQDIFRATKRPSMFESKYVIDKLVELDPVEELRGLMAYLMMLLLERTRG